MANFPSAQQIVDALRAEGLTVVETPGWRDACRCCTGPHHNTGPHVRQWIAWNGITIHHTGGPAYRGSAAKSYSSPGGWLRIGPKDAPGPLCLSSLDADGIVYMVGAGRANHVGGISQAALDRMKAASFPDSGSINLRGSAVDGNAYTLGLEIMAPGAPSDAQRAAAVKWAAALCRIAKWDGGEVHGHGEVSSARDFADPGLDMGAFRRDVKARLSKSTDSKPAATKPAAPKAPTPKPSIYAMGQGRPISWAVTERGMRSGKPSGNVKILQTILQAQKHNGTPLYDGRLDGIYGAQTKAAVKRYQEIAFKTSDPRVADGLLGWTSFSKLTSWAGWRPVK